MVPITTWKGAKIAKRFSKDKVLCAPGHGEPWHGPVLRQMIKEELAILIEGAIYYKHKDKLINGIMDALSFEVKNRRLAIIIQDYKPDIIFEDLENKWYKHILRHFPQVAVYKLQYMELF
ncbi:MAG: hypothetical protein ACOC35_05340 [Promethearchaeia archaeon]